MKIKLTQEDKDWIEDYTQRFYEHKGKETSLKKQPYKGDDPLYPDRKGYTGEYVIHKFFGVEMPDFNPEYTKRDMLLGYKGSRLICDIKTTVYTNYGDSSHCEALTVSQGVFNSNLDERKIDVFIGVQLNKELSIAEIHGVISWEKFLKIQEPFVFKDGGKAPSVPVSELLYLSNDFKYLES